MRKKIKISKSKLKKLYKEKGLSIYEIAKILDCGNKTIWRRLHEFNIGIRIPKRVKISKEELKKLYTKIPTTEITKKYGCSRSTILRKLHEFNLPVRSTYKYIRINKDKLEELYIKQRKSAEKIAQIFNCNYGTILNRLRDVGIKIRDSSEAHIKYPKNNFSGNLLEKAYLIGFRLGDLYVGRYEKGGKTIVVQCASTKLEQIELIKKLFQKYGYVRVNDSNEKGRVPVCVALNESFNFLLKKNDEIEEWIISDDKYFLAFLAGYIDAEGCILTNSKGSSIRIRSYDKNILEESTKKLKSLGILDVDFGLEIKKEDREDLSKDVWRLGVYSKKSLLKLFDLIEDFIHHEKRKRDLENAKQSTIRRNIKYGNIRMSEVYK